MLVYTDNYKSKIWEYRMGWEGWGGWGGRAGHTKVTGYSMEKSWFLGYFWPKCWPVGLPDNLRPRLLFSLLKAHMTWTIHTIVWFPCSFGCGLRLCMEGHWCQNCEIWQFFDFFWSKTGSGCATIKARLQERPMAFFFKMHSCNSDSGIWFMSDRS